MIVAANLVEADVILKKTITAASIRSRKPQPLGTKDNDAPHPLPARQLRAPAMTITL